MPTGLPTVGSLVGRDQQRRELRALWADAVGGRGRLAVISGEAGIGKTHLVEDLVAHVRETDPGAVIAWGSCSSADAPPLWTWRSILRALDVALPAGPAGPAGIDADATSRQVRVAIVDAVRDGFRAPGVVVIDDLQWAGPDSLAVLRLCAGELRDLPILLAVTVRPDEPSPTAVELRRLLADLAASTCTIHLRGLDRAGVSEMVTMLVGQPVGDQLVAAIHDRTGANPLLVRELVRLLEAEGGLADGDAARHGPLPSLMRDILLQRVESLTAETRALLEVAAVAGREISFAALAGAADRDIAAVTRGVEAATTEGLVLGRGGVVRFSHDLLRDALVAHLSERRCRELHARVADALRRHGGPGSGLSEIAGHLVAAYPAVAAEVVAGAALRAGRDALARHAPGVAAAQLRRGLEVAAHDDPLVTELLLELGAALATGGDHDASVEAFEAAAASARGSGDAVGLARAAVGAAGLSARPRTDPELVALLEEALAGLSGRRDAIMSEVMRSLAHALLFSDQVERRNRLVDDAVAIAREVDDPSALSHALYVWLLVHETSTNFDQRLARATELLTTSRATGSREIEASALHHHARQMAELGDYVTYDADVAACDAIGREISSVPWQWTALLNRAMRAVMVGDFLEGERLADEAFALGAGARIEAATATYGAHLMALRTWQGRLDEMLGLAIASAGEYRELPAVWASVPYIRAEIGDLEQASVDLAGLVDDDRMRGLPGAQSWTVAVAMLARVAHLTESPGAATRLLALLEPIGPRHIVGPYADCYFGPAALYRGLCHVAAGDPDAAVRDLEAAVRAASDAGAVPVAAWASAELAVVQRSLGLRAVERPLESALASLRRLGMAHHATRLRQAFDAVRSPSHTSRPRLAAGAVAENRFHPAGDHWTITFAGDTVQLRDIKGLGDIHRLVGSPGAEVHVFELTGADGASAAGVSTQPVLDDQAKRAYRARLTELDAELDDADRCADLARSERARLERDALLDQLRVATGLGGRDRAMLAEPERARQAVRARIRYALDKLRSLHPALHQHLDRSLTTGTYCSYRPEQPVDWRT